MYSIVFFFTLLMIFFYISVLSYKIPNSRYAEIIDYKKKYIINSEKDNIFLCLSTSDCKKIYGKENHRCIDETCVFDIATTTSTTAAITHNQNLCENKTYKIGLTYTFNDGYNLQCINVKNDLIDSNTNQLYTNICANGVFDYNTSRCTCSDDDQLVYFSNYYPNLPRCVAKNKKNLFNDLIE